MFQRHSTIPYPLTPTRLKIKSIEIKNEFSDDLEKTSRTKRASYVRVHAPKRRGREGRRKRTKYKILRKEKKESEEKRRRTTVAVSSLFEIDDENTPDGKTQREGERERDWRYSCRAPKPHRITHDPCFAADRRFEIFPN